MENGDYKKYTVQAKRGIRGEAFFETLISSFSLPYHVTGLSDIGVDYFCEWVHGDKPTGILYAVQVKTFSEKTAKPKWLGVNKGLNGLDTFEIKNPNLVIDEKTRFYWKGLGIPIYLFAVVDSIDDEGKEQLDCYYKRYAPILTRDLSMERSDFYQMFYKANDGALFLAFKDFEKSTQGFARDLYIDCVRMSYYKGVLPCLNPRSMGLNQFSEVPAFADLFKNYKDQILSAYQWTGQVLTVLQQSEKEKLSSEKLASP